MDGVLRPGVSSATFQYLAAYVWRRVARWYRCKHPGISRRSTAAATAAADGSPGAGDWRMFDAGQVTTTRYHRDR